MCRALETQLWSFAKSCLLWWGCGSGCVSHRKSNLLPLESDAVVLIKQPWNQSHCIEGIQAREFQYQPRRCQRSVFDVVYNYFKISVHLCCHLKLIYNMFCLNTNFCPKYENLQCLLSPQTLSFTADLTVTIPIYINNWFVLAYVVLAYVQYYKGLCWVWDEAGLWNRKRLGLLVKWYLSLNITSVNLSSGGQQPSTRLELELLTLGWSVAVTNTM